MTPEIHRSKFGTYHPNPNSEVAWTVHDSRGYIDGGSPCDSCDKCDCLDHEALEFDSGEECVGLSFAYVCLDSGDTLCPDCAKAESITIADCDCE